MKLSLFGYNRKEADDCFSYLNENNATQAGQIADLKKKLDAAEKMVDEYQKLDALSRSETEELNRKFEDCKATYEAQKAELEAQKAENDDLRKQLDELTKQTNGNKSAFEADKLGFIFAVAYKDIESKNKAVSAKIREYAETMFDRMSEYRNQVASIVGTVTEMQNRQKEEMQRLCEEATEQLDRLTEASAATIDDMQRIEASRRSICDEIDNMVLKTIDTSGEPFVIESPEHRIVE